MYFEEELFDVFERVFAKHRLQRRPLAALDVKLQNVDYSLQTKQKKKEDRKILIRRLDYKNNMQTKFGWSC